MSPKKAREACEMATQWTFFTKTTDMKAQCNICKTILSYRSTSGNLKKHIMRKHANVWYEFPSRTSIQNETDKEDIDSPDPTSYTANENIALGQNSTDCSDWDQPSFFEVKVEPTKITSLENSTGYLQNYRNQNHPNSFPPQSNVHPTTLIWTDSLEKQSNENKGAPSNEDTDQGIIDDYDKMFMMSLLPAYKRLKPNDKLDVQMEMLQSINNRLKTYASPKVETKEKEY